MWCLVGYYGFILFREDTWWKTVFSFIVFFCGFGERVEIVCFKQLVGGGFWIDKERQFWVLGFLQVENYGLSFF